MQLADQFRELVDSFSDLIGKHLKLARVELKEDATAVGIDLGRLLAFAPLLLVGYLMLMVATGLFLHRFIAADVAFLIVGGVNLAGGGVGIAFAIKKLKQRALFNDTKEALETTAIALRIEQ